jgi:hypothetical protein
MRDAHQERVQDENPDGNSRNINPFIADPTVSKLLGAVLIRLHPTDVRKTLTSC